MVVYLVYSVEEQKYLGRKDYSRKWADKKEDAGGVFTSISGAKNAARGKRGVGSSVRTTRADGTPTWAYSFHNLTEFELHAMHLQEGEVTQFTLK